MVFRNGDHGYGLVTKLLHWVTVGALTAQFVVGWTMDADAELDREDDLIDQLEDQGEDAAEARGEAAEDAFEADIDRLRDELDSREDNYLVEAYADVTSGRFLGDGVSLPEIHILLGLFILLLGVTRIIWRATTALPPWAPHLSARERAVESLLEKLLLGLLFAVPLSGLLLIFGGTDLLAVHIAAQIVLLAAVAAHVGLVLKHTVLRRNRHLSRMV